jgi:hypothetical protein
MPTVSTVALFIPLTYSSLKWANATHFWVLLLLGSGQTGSWEKIIPPTNSIESNSQFSLDDFIPTTKSLLHFIESLK